MHKTQSIKSILFPLSVNYVKTNNTVITASSGSTLRLWTMDGLYIGAFGQETPWVIGIPSSYSPLPADVKTEVQIETQRALLLQSQKEALKKNVLDTWRGIFGYGV
jgi:hypothetical protein